MTKWRVLSYQEFDAFTNMAIDEAIGESVSGGGSPTIRFYGWKPSAISIGYFQAIRDEVNLANCEAAGVNVVRRRTGGGAVYHDQVGEITYSVTGKVNLFPEGIVDSYKVICSWIIDSLALLDIKAEFKPINDLISNGKKISGNAQTRRNGVLLQHGTILYSVDVDRMFSLLNVPDEKIKDKLIANVKERVTSVTAQRPVSKDELYKALFDGFTKNKDFESGKLTDTEVIRAKELAQVRYVSKDWNFMR
ncbi:Lipoate-protein ligase A subunit 1 [Candidatus Bilamarchaeum dharawalense]|uniref:Lipoate-protein ligase A subunit 1 n=1 Tax=Candidatus Bilamarchaeum dharawalense TaxID=2885759 RepID=A0A5E4LKI2_9ARCH|nr:Lipoate-protein ligase A subunit 1 [Candidatus Bilamarchaeum dharawalense]